MTATASLTVSLLGFSTNSDNFGLGALTEAQVAILRDIAAAQGIDIKIRIIDWKQPRTSYITGDDIEIIELVRSDFLKPTHLFKWLRESDLVIDIGAGDSFADIYGPKRLLLMFAMKYQAHLAGTPFVLAPQTMGPFKSRWSRWLARPHLALCKAVFARDELSRNFLEELGYRKAKPTVCDVALLLPFDTLPPAEPGAPIKVGINVSGLLMAGGYNKSNMFGLKSDYPGLIRSLIEDFTGMEGVELHLVGHVLSKEQEVEDDFRACEALAREYPAVVLAPYFASPSEAKTYIANMDFFMGARMHATIAAFSSETPVIPMAYSRKFRGLYGSLGFDRTVECTSEPAEDIRTKILAGFNERETVTAEVKAALAKGHERLKIYTDTLGEIIAGIAAKS